MNLTIEEIKAKIALVESDIGKVSGGTAKHAELLNDYRDYLLDELKTMLKNAEDNQNASQSR
jgi:hypothetical protein